MIGGKKAFIEQPPWTLYSPSPLFSHGFGFGVADPDGVARTLSARYYKDGSEILIAQDGKNPRRLTPRECARLQGFPDDFVIPVSDTQAYKQFGNSVVVPLMTNVAQLVVAKMLSLKKVTGQRFCTWIYAA